ncbi:MAG: hypothetical protein R3E31_17780 [Chloroflexota bacterium]
MMATVTPLSVDALYRRCELNQLPFETTAELPPLDEIIGQERAVEAIQFGIGIHHDGFNLFALGPNGTGKYTAVAQFLNQKPPPKRRPMTGATSTTSTRHTNRKPCACPVGRPPSCATK